MIKLSAVSVIFNVTAIFDGLAEIDLATAASFVLVVEAG
jgi:hypothetical protein